MEMTEKEKLDLKGKQTNYFCVHGKENCSRKEKKGVGTVRQGKARNREQKDQKMMRAGKRMENRTELGYQCQKMK